MKIVKFAVILVMVMARYIVARNRLTLYNLVPIQNLYATVKAM